MKKLIKVLAILTEWFIKTGGIATGQILPQSTNCPAGLVEKP